MVTPKMGASASQTSFMGRFPVPPLGVGSGPPVTLTTVPPFTFVFLPPNTMTGKFR